MKKEAEWVGTVSYQNMVRLDATLTDVNNRIVKLKNDTFRIERI